VLFDELPDFKKIQSGLGRKNIPRAHLVLDFSLAR
jgi:hypothetical protein